MEIKKTLTETYTLKDDGCLWAKINIDCGEQSVNVMISSDYGEYNYFWGSTGSNPKQFLTDIDMYYGMNKLMHGNKNMYLPDWEERKKSFKEMIIEERKDGNISKNEARNSWTEMMDIFDECQHSEDIYFEKVWNSDVLESVIFDTDSIPSNTKLNPRVNEFWKKIWIPFTNELKTELDAV